MRTLEAALAKQMEKPDFKREYDSLEPEFAVITKQHLARRTKLASGMEMNVKVEFVPKQPRI